MKAGKLRYRVALQSPVYAESHGERTVANWRTEARVWADVFAVSARERYAANQTQADLTHRVRIRALDGLHSTWRVLWGTRELYLTAPPRDIDTAEIELLCVEKEAAAT